MSSISILAYIILAASIGYAFIYSPMGDLTALMDKKQQYEDSLEKVKNIENIKNELLTKFNNISDTDKKDIDTVLPNSFNFVRFISQIDTVAAKYGISIKSITSTEQSSSSDQSEKIYNSAIIGFSFDASYDKFNSFMADLEKSMRILDIKSVKLTAKDNGIYLYNVEFQTYWLKQK